MEHLFSHLPHLISHTVADSVNMLPFLFLAYLLIEWIEQRSSARMEGVLTGFGKFGAPSGALLGCIPQCGFSAAAANLFSNRLITTGTLIAVFLSTSDEAIPVLLANPSHAGAVGKLLLCKILIAMIAGMAVDLIFSSKVVSANETLHQKHADCEQEHHGVLRSALFHTLHIFLFILAVTFVLNLITHHIDQSHAGFLLQLHPFWQTAIAALAGFVPNCASSVLLTTLYVDGQLSFGATVAGLCTGAGIGLAVLFKENRSLAQNLQIVAILYAVSIAAGMLIEFVG